MRAKLLLISLIIIIAVAIGGIAIRYRFQKAVPVITTFEECAQAGYPIMESYPPQCRTDNQTFTQDIGADALRIPLTVAF